MGCDIHAHIEIKVNGKWHHYSQPRINRNYALFTKMAGIRSENHEEIEPISEPRGVPENASFTTRFDCIHWSSDGHSHSWLNDKELQEVIDFHGKLLGEGNMWHAHHYEWGYLFGNVFSMKYPKEYPKGLEDVRIIFWFDN